MKTKKLSRRSKVRVISFMFALMLVTAALAVVGWVKAMGLKTQIEYSYLRALGELQAHVTNVDASLEKCLYAGTSEQAVMLSSRVWRDAGSAKTCLAALPYDDSRLDKTEKFLSQVGEYAYSLSLSTANGSEISDGDYGTLKQLSDYAGELKESIAQMVTDISQESYTLDEVENELNGSTAPEEGRIKDFEATFEDYPTLIYDGPYSDHLTDRKPKFTEGKAHITQSEAQAVAAEFLGKKAEELTFISEQGGNLPLYEFSVEDTYISVTRAGGYVATVNDSRDIGETAYGVSDGLDSAEKYLQNRGIDSMKYTYYLEDGDRLTVNFAYSEKGAVCYTDLIKVTVALDNLSVVSFEAEGYIINHYSREIPQEVISVGQAMESVSKRLTVEGGQAAFITPRGLNEYYVYEFNCLSEDKRQVLVYIDAQNGRAVDMLLLEDTPGGTLTI